MAEGGVVRHLDLVFPAVAPPHRRQSVTGPGVLQARDRLGEQALRALFESTADCWARASAQRYRWRGLTVYGVDGSKLRIPDTPGQLRGLRQSRERARTRWISPGAGRGVDGPAQPRPGRPGGRQGRRGRSKPRRLAVAQAARALAHHRGPRFPVLPTLSPDPVRGYPPPLAHPGQEKPQVAGPQTARAQRLPGRDPRPHKRPPRSPRSA